MQLTQSHQNERCHATYSHAKQVYIIQIYTQANQEEYLGTIACSMKIKIIYNRENQSCQIKWYTMSSLYIWSDQNKTWQKQSHYAKQGKMSNQHNQHINVSNKYSNEAREKLPRSESSIKINNHQNQYVHVLKWIQYLSMHPMISRTLNVQSRDRYPLIDLSIATFASF